jgi:zinc protease
MKPKDYMINQHVYKTVLDNGLTIIVAPRHQIPKVSLQIWYNVGSKDELSGEKGIAHLIEHMIFKGTTILSESDINTIVHKLSGVCNAFTSYDYTGYLFDVPSQHWKAILPIMADCMRNCTFKPDLLNSELKAVIQELKMYNDDYGSTLVERMVSAMFADHPYHHPIIGYKQDLWSLKRENLLNFYYRHYVPNNATLVIVGDVTIDDVMKETEKVFLPLQPDAEYSKQEFYHSFDLMSHETTLYRDIQQPIVMVSWAVPGSTAQQDYVLDLVSWILGSGKGSRLSQLLVDKLELVTELDCFVQDMFDHGILFIYFQPKNYEDTDKIIDLINQELTKLATTLVSDYDLTRAIKKTEVDFISLSENNQKMAYLLGKYFLATGNERYLVDYIKYPKEGLKEHIRSIIHDYLRPSVIQRGQVLPLPEGESDFWHSLQDQSDAEDARVLSLITREAEVEEALHAKNIIIEKPLPFTFPHAQEFELQNGIKVLAYHNPETPKIDLVLDFKAKHFYDPEDKQGLSMMLADVLQEGTKKHNATSFAEALESSGMELNTFPGQIHIGMLSVDLDKGLNLLNEVLQEASLSEEAIERVRAQMLAELRAFWDTPAQFAGQLIKKEIYKNHPYAKEILGDKQSIQSITRSDVINAYEKFITPSRTRLAIVGDLERYPIQEILNATIGTWQGPELVEIDYPPLIKPMAHVVDYPINRDQIVLCFGGLSIDRMNPAFDKLLLFDQIFSGGVLGSMSSRLFELRERSGLFYTISGSLLAAVGKQPGLALVKTIVSPDRLAEAEREIKKVIDTAASTLTHDELEEAQRAIVNSLVDHFAANKSIASTFLFLDEYGFPKDYFDKRAEQLMKVTLQEIKEAVAPILNSSNMVTLRIGRL